VTEPAPVDEYYRSVDSAPARYSRTQPPSRTNGFLLTFAGVSLLVQLGYSALAARSWVPDARDLVFFSAGGQAAVLPARLFLFTFFIVFACWIDTNIWRRLLIAVELVGGLTLASLIIDAVALEVRRLLSIEVQLLSQQVLTALLALVVFPLVVLTHNAVLPPPLPRPTARPPRIPWYQWTRVFIPVLVAVLVAGWVEYRWLDAVSWLRSWALLGGVGPGLFLVQQLFVIQTALVGLWLIRRSRRRHADFHPDIAVIVPAHNEAHDIAATIAAVAAAAHDYPARVTLYVVDNASSDSTVDVARAAIAATEHLVGVVLECPTPGKAIALNYGLSQIDEAFVVRIDADTVIGPDCLRKAVRHLAKPDVGAVGGLPMPTSHRTFFDRVRHVEVLLRHGFYQVNLLGIGGVIAVPGMFVVYRKAALDAAGDLVQGMNGEDTDICLRMGVLGYRTVVEPSAVYYSETPQSWSHMREQRTRWFRSAYHVAGHNRHVIFGTESMASAVTLPFQLASAARRAMFAPLLIAAPLALLVFPDTFTALAWTSVIATVVGLPFLVALGVCVAWRHWRAVLYLPEYLVFRVIRSWFTLGALFSLVYPPLYPRFRRFGR
jgi:cellulose synthase/poly-beta-1,6-N-acetylglucosamine synthase-like glycosyltransferase